MPDEDERVTSGPTDDVEYDEDALRKAEERMHAGGHGGAGDPDPPGGHDPEALEDAADKMGVDRS
jgi:hypothetical protein